QIFEMRLEGLFREGIFDEEKVEQNLLLFRKSFHSRDNKFSRLLNADLAEDAVDNIHFVDFFRYFSAPAADIRRYLREKGWIQPEDTGFCSSNCLINDVGIYVHMEKEGYHFYAPQLSWDCRLGCIPRKQGLKEVAFAGDGKYELTGRILEEIGYYNPPIKDAVVLDRDGDNGDRKLIAYLVSHEQLVVPELRDYLAGKLPDYMIPSNFLQVEKIPLTPNGKVDKKSLENEGTQVGTGVEFEAPKNDIEEKMVEIWKEVLHADKLGTRDNFFDLGGNSMDIMRLNSRLIKIFETDIPVAVHFRYTTIKSFVQYLGQEGVDDSHINDRADELKRGEQSKMSRLKARRGARR
ncbi:MAG: hypothetical protein GY950_21240, partial [bacterium]|nr:hypothetical protein [bacterium]